jgi:hypothetical protein
MKESSMRRMMLTIAGAAMLVAPSAALMAAPVMPQGEVIEIHTGRGKTAVRSGPSRQYRSYSVQPAPRTYRAPAQPSGGRVIQSAPMQAPAPVRAN